MERLPAYYPGCTIEPESSQAIIHLGVIGPFVSNRSYGAKR
jgi:hypothetical protein